MANSEKGFMRPWEIPITLGVVLLAGSLALLILVVDLRIPLGVAGGVPYIAVVLIALKSPRKKFVILMSVICSLLVVVGYYASPAGGEMWKVLSNRGLALFAIWVTAVLGVKNRARQRELFREHLKFLKAERELLLSQETLKLEQAESRLEIEAQRLRVLKATMRTVMDIVGNFLNGLLLFRREAEKNNALKPESLSKMDSMIQDTSRKLKKLEGLDEVREVKIVGNIVGIDFESSGDDPNQSAN